MKISSGSHVTLAYKLRLEGDEVVDQATKEEPLSFVVGVGRMMPGLEKHIEGMEAGQQGTFAIAPAEGYGERRPELEDKIPRSRFPEDGELYEGLVFHAQTPHGPLRFTVISFNDEEVTVDLNHPLAGQTLNFEVELLEVREATPEELAGGGGGCGCGEEAAGCGHDHGGGGGCGGGQGGCC